MNIITFTTALEARLGQLDERHECALRLFNGYYEGGTDLVVDLYGRTAVIYNFAALPQDLRPEVEGIQAGLSEYFPWLECIVLKERSGFDEEARWGRVVWGSNPARKVRENGVWYALDVCMNQDASLYLDTSNLRTWLKAHSNGIDVLNTFAYTGSLGAAAMAGGANRAVQLDRTRRFLNLAKETYALNGFPVQKANFIAADFFVVSAQMRRRKETYGGVILDPPYFSTSEHGKVDLVAESEQVINKVRPLVADGGWLVAINNSLFLSGAEYMRTLEKIGADGFVTLEEIIPVGEDFTGYAQTRVGQAPTDPAPFNHSTKIAVLRVKRKQAGPQP